VLLTASPRGARHW